MFNCRAKSFSRDITHSHYLLTVFSFIKDKELTLAMTHKAIHP